MNTKTKNKSAHRISIQCASTNTLLPATRLLTGWCRAVLEQQKIRKASITIRLVDRRESATLNKRYRNKAGATNVLSFPAELPAGLPLAALQHELGDLVICAPVVAREARAQYKTIQAHWAHMVVHGCLHLLGYDHIKKQDASTMEALEIKILGQLGFDNPYN